MTDQIDEAYSEKVGPFFVSPSLNPKLKDYLKMSIDFWTEERLKTFLFPLTTSKRKHPVSLRCLDWLCTNYAKKRGTVIIVNSNELVDINQSYDEHCQKFNRIGFDPFARAQENRTCDVYYFMDGTKCRTTVAQLNFMKWAIEYSILDYAKKYKDQITTDMSNKQAQKRTKHDSEDLTTQQKRQKRTQISNAPKQFCRVYHVERVDVFPFFSK
jgi:hypothetical protein